MSLYLKDPSSVLDFRHEWAAWLASGETIASSTWTVTPTGLAIDSETETTTTATAWLSGGTPGQIYRVVNRITTNQARTEERTIVIRVEQT
jgi:hypothetical protein